ncbi:MAG: hypothetical protein ACRBBP_10600 [Bdellovibrionales bacterium]
MFPYAYGAQLDYTCKQVDYRRNRNWAIVCYFGSHALLEDYKAISANSITTI